MMIKKATEEQINKFLAVHKHWRVDKAKLTREFLFPNFSAAFGFMTEVAMLSERINHHPDWSNSYNKVVIQLTTHEIGGISERDFDFAAKVDGILACRSETTLSN